MSKGNSQSFLHFLHFLSCVRQLSLLSKRKSKNILLNFDGSVGVAIIVELAKIPTKILKNAHVVDRFVFLLMSEHLFFFFIRCIINFIQRF